jgi:acetyl esterase/lipase
MHWRRFSIAAGLCLATPTAGRQALLTPPAFQAIPSLPADAISRYGPEAEQYGELRVPAGSGRHPVVVLVHGGCFKAAYATLRDLAPMGDALKRQGIATWNIEYRRLGQPGGGWPGTYQDVGAAIDHLRTLASRHRLDLSRLVFVGHSAGGHLALWAAARARVPAASAIASRRPLRPLGAIDLAGPTDMRENIANYHRECRDAVITQMMGGTPEQVPDHYRAASPGALLPLGVPHVLISGEHESFMPRPLASEYVRRARAEGDNATLRIVPGAGHFEVASPHTSAWPVLLADIRRLLRQRRTDGPARN